MMIESVKIVTQYINKRKQLLHRTLHRGER